MQQADDRRGRGAENDESFIASTARLLRAEAEPDDTSAFPALWPEKAFVDEILFANDVAFAVLTHSSALAAWSTTKDSARQTIATPLKGKTTAPTDEGQARSDDRVGGGIRGRGAEERMASPTAACLAGVRSRGRNLRVRLRLQR